MQTSTLIDALLFEEEGTELDFKRDQYPFDRADDRQKSELLKDILAFANAWRRSDAYVLIGIQDVKGGASSAYGVTEHLDDARLQQFVNSKTNRPIEFSYAPMTYKGLQIGVIHIPLQERPTFLFKDYGGLLKNTVYIRRGSSTDIANPDEIARMGAALVKTVKATPVLLARMSSEVDWMDLVEIISFETTCLTHSPLKELPDYEPAEARGPFGLSIVPTMQLQNRDFYRDRTEYLRFTQKLRAVRFSVQNSGEALASGVKVTVQINDPTRNVELALGSDSPAKPSRTWSPAVHLATRDGQEDIELISTRTGWVVNIFIGKVQAKDTSTSYERLLIGLPASGVVEFSVSVFADELSAPVSSSMTVKFTVEERHMTCEQLTQ